MEGLANQGSTMTQGLKQNKNQTNYISCLWQLRGNVSKWKGSLRPPTCTEDDSEVSVKYDILVTVSGQFEGRWVELPSSTWERWLKYILLVNLPPPSPSPYRMCEPCLSDSLILYLTETCVTSVAKLPCVTFNPWRCPWCWSSSWIYSPFALQSHLSVSFVLDLSYSLNYI